MRIATFLTNPSLLDPDMEGLAVHGANIATQAQFEHLLLRPEVDGLDVFLPPRYLVRTDKLKLLADKLLPNAMRGLGRLVFFPIHSAPEILAEPIDRIWWCVGPGYLARDRYLRDRCVEGLCPILCDTHSLGDQRVFASLAPFARVPAANFDKVLCLSDAYKTSLDVTMTAIRPGQGAAFETITRYHFVDTRAFHPFTSSERKEARSRLDLPQDCTLSIYLGRISAKTKADFVPMLRVFAQVASERDRLLLVGRESESGYTNYLRMEADALGVADRLIVRLDPERKDVPSYLACSDLYVFPGDTVQEALAIAVLEAMACGLPVLCSNWDGMKDSVVHEQTGLLIDTFTTPSWERVEALSPFAEFATNYMFCAQTVIVDEADFAKKWKRLLEASDERRRMSTNARARIETVFSPEATMNEWLRIAQRALEEARAETAESRDIRRKTAISLGQPYPYRQAFSHYGCGDLPTNRIVRISPRAAQAWMRGVAPNFYDEVMPLIQPKLLDAAMRCVLAYEHIGVSIERLHDQILKDTGARSSDVWLHVALLIKQGTFVMSGS